MNEKPIHIQTCDRTFAFGVVISCIIGMLGIAAAGPSSSIPQSNHGILRLARSTDPQTLDPAVMVLMEDLFLWPLLHLPLLDWVNVTNLVPCAASAWSASPDYHTFTLQLRSEVKFSNGRPVVADDYIYALERILNPATGSWIAAYLGDIRGAKAFIAGQTNHVAGIRSTSSLVLSIELEHPDPTFPYFLTFSAMPRESIIGSEDHYAVAPVSTGPYMVQEWVRGARLKLRRNPHYHGPEPWHLDGIEILIGGDEATHLMLFERGELDIDNRTSYAVYHHIMTHPYWHNRVDRTQAIYTFGVILNTEIPPFTNVLVRQAINHAIDRDRRMRVALGFNSHAEGIMPPNLPGYNAGLRGYKYDPERARQLLKESGLPLPLHTVLWHATDDAANFIAQGIQWDLHHVGIGIELKMVTGSEMYTAAAVRGKVPMFLGGYGADMPDPKGMLGVQFDGNTVTNTSTLNVSFYNNPEVTHLLKEAALRSDWSLRFKLYQRAEEMIMRDAPWAVLGHQNAFALRQPWLKGPLMDPIWICRFDRVWIEK